MLTTKLIAGKLNYGFLLAGFLIIPYLPFWQQQNYGINSQKINDLEQADESITALRAAIIADAEFAIMTDELLRLERANMPEHKALNRLFYAWVAGKISKKQLIERLNHFKNYVLRKRYLYEVSF